MFILLVMAADRQDPHTLPGCRSRGVTGSRLRGGFGFLPGGLGVFGGPSGGHGRLGAFLGTRFGTRRCGGVVHFNVSIDHLLDPPFLIFVSLWKATTSSC